MRPSGLRGWRRWLLLAWVTVGDNAREWVLVLGLVLLHVGLREVEAVLPGAAWSGPGLVLTGIAIFGVRGGPRPPRKE